MPPKARYTKEEIAEAAFSIVKKDGVASLTARSLADKLRTSVSPIFTAYANMDDVKMAARSIALGEFKEYISDYREYTPAFKRIGMMIVSYGMHEPELFKLMFMQEHKGAQDFRESIRDLGDVADICTDLIVRDYGMTHEQAAMIFEQMWTQAFGLGAMCAMKVCSLSEEEIGRRLSIMFVSLVMLVKSGRMDMVYDDVERSAQGTFHGVKVTDMPDMLAGENA